MVIVWAPLKCVMCAVANLEIFSLEGTLRKKEILGREQYSKRHKLPIIVGVSESLKVPNYLVMP